MSVSEENKEEGFVSLEDYIRLTMPAATRRTWRGEQDWLNEMDMAYKKRGAQMLEQDILPCLEGIAPSHISSGMAYSYRLVLKYIQEHKIEALFSPYMWIREVAKKL